MAEIWLTAVATWEVELPYSSTVACCCREVAANSVAVDMRVTMECWILEIRPRRCADMFLNGVDQLAGLAASRGSRRCR